MQEPSAEDFERIAQEAYARLPAAFRRLADDITINIDDYPAREVLDGFGIRSPYGLLGLYHGVDVTRKSIFDLSLQNDTIFLYRKPILRYWQEGTDSLEAIIEHVLVHEIGHHFGLSDDEMHALEDEADAEESGSHRH